MMSSGPRTRTYPLIYLKAASGLQLLRTFVRYEKPAPFLTLSPITTWPPSPPTMRAAVQLAYGISEQTIDVRELPTPVLDPSSDHVLVRVHAASLGPGDIKLASGDVKLVRGLTFPRVIGHDLAGTVVAVGAKCTRLRVGDCVFGNSEDRGSLAEYCLVPERYLCAKPENISWGEAATLGVAAITAYQAVVDTLGVRSGQRLLVLGGSGGVGTLAVQVAKARGAYVCATTTAQDLVRGLGADRTLDYTTEHWPSLLAGADYDAVLDCVGEGWPRACHVLKPRGSFCAVHYGADSDQPLGVWLLLRIIGRTLWRTLCGHFGLGPYYYAFTPNPDESETLVAVGGLVGAGQLRAVVGAYAPYELEGGSVRAMFGQCMTRHTKGKLVLNVLH